ncbi:hypothetical protein M6B38_332090 [Iris pallida]|uniref:Uncharacterized protein n=1 Tax=Iris pallida TaxID=29817 RepID=A0AAX6GJ29_IRIPA|nr:hypothetical protein M6B38_364030 [Iris pallida]KAJ6835505.1 hypothetical protein M6B38_332090 [Iris pallida]
MVTFILVYFVSCLCFSIYESVTTLLFDLMIVLALIYSSCLYYFKSHLNIRKQRKKKPVFHLIF